MRRLTAVLLVGLLFAGCASPTTRLRALADSHGFDRSTVVIDGFRHTVFSNGDRRGNTLHVYLEGDGSPWRHRTLIMSDPTPRRPLMLRLMAFDDQPSIYVGRPCYNGTATEPGCNNSLWTSDRYSEVVVSSMAGVIRELAERRNNPLIKLFGHSGGGALALLLAERLPDVTDIVTIAGNLDTDAWISHHGYTPLYGSLNPATRPPLEDSLRQWHLVGERDQVIPPPLVHRFIDSQPSAYGVHIRGFTHACCWGRVWARVLDAVERIEPDAMPGYLFKRATGVSRALPETAASALANQ